MPSWWGKSKTKQEKRPKEGSMRLQIGGWRSRRLSLDEERRSPSSDGSPRPVSDSARQPWPLPASPLSPQGGGPDLRKTQSFPLPLPRDDHNSGSSSLSSSGSGDICRTADKIAITKECRSHPANNCPSTFSLSTVPPAKGGDKSSPCFSPCPSPRAILDAGDAFLTAAAVPAVHSPRPSMTGNNNNNNNMKKAQAAAGHLSPRHSSHPLPSPPRAASYPLSPTLSPSNNRSSATTCWQKGKLIGNGSFGYVYVGFDSNNIGRMCAMKEVHIIGDSDQSKESAKQLEQEITLLSRLRHQNIVQYYGSESVEGKLYIYLEYVSGGSIHKLLQDYGPFKESVIRRYTRQILSGLSFLHSMETVHRDIKGANILVDTNGAVKLADFGMAKHITAQSFPLSCKGSPYWMAPEILKSTHGYDLSVDIWSLGCTVIEMATGKPPWSEYEGVAVLFKIGNSRETPMIPDFLSEEGQYFLNLCLQRDPADRPTAAELMEHPFVMDIPDSNLYPRSLNSPESYLSSGRYTPPRQVQTGMFFASAPSQFGFYPINSETEPEMAVRPAVERRSRSNVSEFGYLFGGSDGQVPVIHQTVHQRFASCLDLKC